jgi:hypothetical protein
LTHTGHVARSLSLPRVLALVGGLALVAAFFMPWFSSQGLQLSGQFLHNFLASAGPNELRRFLPNTSPTEVQLLRALVDLFPICGVVAGSSALLGGLVRTGRAIADAILALSGLLALSAWAIGLTRLPPGSMPEVGLWLMGLGCVSILLGLALELGVQAHAKQR